MSKHFPKDLVDYLSTSEQPTNALDKDLCFVFANKAYLEATHSTLEDLMGNNVFDVFPESEERVQEVKTLFEATLEGETTYLEAQPYELELDDGSKSLRYWRAIQEPYPDAEGAVHFIIQRAVDATDEIESKMQNELVARELAHRMKNMMTIVRSIARLTAKHATSVEEYSSGFVKRLDTIARTYSQLESGAWEGLTLNRLLEDELMPYNNGLAERVRLQGPNIALSVQSTKDLSLILHELATNAAKYGAFAHDQGTLDVSWQKRAGAITIEWQETSINQISKPTRSGFGSQMFKMIRDIQVERDFRSTGLHATLTLSLKTLANQLADDIDLTNLS